MSEQFLRALESAYVSFVAVFLFAPLAVTIYIHAATGLPFSPVQPFSVIEPIDNPFLFCCALGVLLCCAPGRFGRLTITAGALMIFAVGICDYNGATQTQFEVAELLDTHEQIAIVWDGGDTVYGEELDGHNRMSGRFVMIPNPQRDLGQRKTITVKR